MTPWWRRAAVADVPPDDGWLTEHERAVLAGLVVDKRRRDWRLGRWTAKSLVASVVGVPLAAVEVRAAEDGAPEPFVNGAPAGLSLSLSHRDGVAVTAAARLPTVVGIDLETLEERSDAFVREWLSDEERATLPGVGPDRDLRVLCSWTGKEASAKAQREGLRLDVRQAVVRPAAPAGCWRWSPLTVSWPLEAIEHRGWWRVQGREIIAVVTDPPTGRPPPDDGASAPERNR